MKVWISALLVGVIVSTSVPVYSADEPQSLTVTVYEFRSAKEAVMKLRASMEVSDIPGRIGPEMIPSFMGAIEKLKPLSTSSCSSALSKYRRGTCSFHDGVRKMDVSADLIGTLADGVTIIDYGLNFEAGAEKKSFIDTPNAHVELKRGTADVRVDAHDGADVIQHIIVVEYR